METILLTGFGPFGPYSRNASEEAVRSLDGVERDGFVFRSLRLPVQFERAVAALEEALEAERPAAVIGTGIHGDADGPYRLEVAARNEREYPCPDADGHVVTGSSVEDGGPAMVFSSLPLGAIRHALGEVGVRAELSEDAGRYLCNAVFYWLARRVTSAGFLHVPPALERVEETTRAVEAAAVATARRLVAQRVEATA